MMGAVHAVAAAVSVVISVPAILLEGVVTLVVSVARPTGGVTLMAHADLWVAVIITWVQLGCVLSGHL